MLYFVTLELEFYFRFGKFKLLFNLSFHQSQVFILFIPSFLFCSSNFLWKCLRCSSNDIFLPFSGTWSSTSESFLKDLSLDSRLKDISVVQGSEKVKLTPWKTKWHVILLFSPPLYMTNQDTVKLDPKGQFPLQQFFREKRKIFTYRVRSVKASFHLPNIYRRQERNRNRKFLSMQICNVM